MEDLFMYPSPRPTYKQRVEQIRCRYNSYFKQQLPAVECTIFPRGIGNDVMCNAVDRRKYGKKVTFLRIS